MGAFLSCIDAFCLRSWSTWWSTSSPIWPRSYWDADRGLTHPLRLGWAWPPSSINFITNEVLPDQPINSLHPLSIHESSDPFLPRLFLSCPAYCSPDASVSLELMTPLSVIEWSCHERWPDRRQKQVATQRKSVETQVRWRLCLQ